VTPDVLIEITYPEYGIDERSMLLEAYTSPAMRATPSIA
jgi:hypothetical protein